MLAVELISNTIRPLRTTDTVQQALDRLAEFKLYHLPLVNEGQFMGMLAEEQLLEVEQHELRIAAVPLTLINPFVYQDAHIYEVIRVFRELQLSVLPVLDQQKSYLGMITIQQLLEYTAELYAVKEPGGIIVLEGDSRSSSLAHMAQIVEGENAQVLSAYTQSFPDSTRMEVTLKINRTSLSAILSAFERYDYQVKAVFNNTAADDSTADRYNSLMNYLNV